MELRLPLEMSPGREAACRAVFGTWRFFPNDARKNCPFVLTSFTGWSSERCPGIGFLSRGDREIGVLRNVDPPTRPRRECCRETSLILRSDRKVGNPFQTKQGSRPSCPDQEGRRGSEEVLPENFGVPLEGDRDLLSSRHSSHVGKSSGIIPKNLPHVHLRRQVDCDIIEPQMKRLWKIGLAVSGGADSTALAVLMSSLAREHGFRAVVLHVDHGIRADSAMDARFVKQLAARLELPFHCTDVQSPKNL